MSAPSTVESHSLWVYVSRSAEEWDNIATLLGISRCVALAVIADDQTARLTRIDNAAQIAARDRFSVLRVVAFLFFAEAKCERLGRLDILLVQVNRTISEFKSNTEDSVFIMVGEPSLRVVELPDEKFRITVERYNIYDSSSGNGRVGSSLSNIDCSMLDTEYDAQSFLAHRNHFPAKSRDSKRHSVRESNLHSGRKWIR